MYAYYKMSEKGEIVYMFIHLVFHSGLMGYDAVSLADS
jgi:hypothetical protein